MINWEDFIKSYNKRVFISSVIIVSFSDFKGITFIWGYNLNSYVGYSNIDIISINSICITSYYSSYSLVILDIWND